MLTENVFEKLSPSTQGFSVFIVCLASGVGTVKTVLPCISLSIMSTDVFGVPDKNNDTCEPGRYDCASTYPLKVLRTPPGAPTTGLTSVALYCARYESVTGGTVGPWVFSEK